MDRRFACSWARDASPQRAISKRGGQRQRETSDGDGELNERCARPPCKQNCPSSTSTPPALHQHYIAHPSLLSLTAAKLSRVNTQSRWAQVTPSASCIGSAVRYQLSVHTAVHWPPGPNDLFPLPLCIVLSSPWCRARTLHRHLSINSPALTALKDPSKALIFGLCF